MGGTPRSSFAMTIGLMIAIITLLVPFSVSCSKPPRPTADFTFSCVSGELLISEPIAGTAPLTIQFTDQSSGEITSWRWNFGDGPAIEGSGEEYQNPRHTYTTVNSGFVVVLTVKGPGGRSPATDKTVVTILNCQEAATSELSQAKVAVQGCLSAAGKTALDSGVLAWDGSRGQVTANGKDAADYLNDWKTFKATYVVEVSGEITQGTDVSWGCVYWNPTSPMGARWMAI